MPLARPSPSRCAHAKRKTQKQSRDTQRTSQKNKVKISKSGEAAGKALALALFAGDGLDVLIGLAVNAACDLILLEPDELLGDRHALEAV